MPTKIEWTDVTWNPVTGCSKVSAGCRNCYAECMAKRLRAMGSPKYADGFAVTTHPQCLDEPLTLKKPCNIFVCSMSDLFHEDVSDNFIDEIMGRIRACQQHHFQVLTKRAERLRSYFSSREVPSNLWLGVTVEDHTHRNRIDELRQVEATVRFLSCEPLLDDLGSLDLEGIHWVIVGGESGPRARRMQPEWVVKIKTQAEEQGAAFFFKQWGTWGADGKKRSKKANGKLLSGEVVQNLPTVA